MIKSLLHNEIHEQPIILSRLLKTAKEPVQALAEAMVSLDSAM